MQSFLDCVPCLINQCLRAARLATDDPGLQRKAVNAVLDWLTTADLTQSPIDISLEPHRLVREATGNPDPYADVKRRSSEEALVLYPELKARVEAAEDPLETAVRIAVAGNIMDFGALASFDVEATLDRAMGAPFAIDQMGAFRDAVARSRRILYLLDNAGEIVFDKVLIEHLAEGREVTAVVRSELFINDVMREDAEQVGLEKVARIIEAPPAKTEPEVFGGAWEWADLIIAKGQANFEAFRDCEGPIFCLLIIKCPVLAADVGAKAGDLVLQAAEAL